MKWRAVLVLPAVAALACGGDPEARKRQFVAEGDRYMAEEKYAEAVVQYRNAVKDDARFGEGRFKLAEAFAAAGDPRNAVLEAVRAADLLQEDADAQLRAGTFLLLARQYPEARQRAMAVLAKDPKNARAMVLLGNALAGLKDLDGAIEQVEQAVGEDPLLTLTYSNLGALQLAKGDRDAAEATFKRAVSTVPDSADARLSLANFYWAVGRREEAEVELVAALKIDPKSAIGNRALGAFYLGQNRLAEAEPYLKAYADITGNTDARLVLSDYYVRSGKSAEAAKILNPLVLEREGRFPAIVRLAALDFGAGRRDEAYARIDQILKEQPEAVRALQAKTEFLLLEGKAKEALAASSALVEADARGSRSRYLRGLALEAAGKTPDALATFRDLLTSMPSSVAVQSKLAEVSMRQGRSKEALSLALQVVKARPRSVAAHFLYAQALVGVGDLPNAERELLAVQKVIPQSADVHTWLGILYDRKQDLISSRRAYEQALELSPDDRRALAGLVGVDLQEKKPATALARIESRIPGAPDDITLAGIKGRAALEAGDLAKAEDAYRRVLELDENNIEAYGRLSSIYWAQNRLDEAKKSLEALARQQSKPVAAETLIGMILVRQNKPDEARKHFERALDINSRAAVAANSLAWDYANTGGNLDVALQLAQAAKAQLPTVGEITDTLGWIYYKKGLSSLAVSTFREAVQQSPTNPRIHYRLGLAHLQNGDKVSAKSALQQALKLNLDAENATEARRVLNTL